MARGSLAGKSIVCTTTVMELLEMGKDIKVTHSVSSPPPKERGDLFLKKALHGGTIFLANLWEDVLHGNYWSNHARGRKSFTNEFSSNLNTVNLKIFPGHGGRHTGK